MSIFSRALGWLNDRSGIPAAVKPVLEHPVPPNTGWWYVFGSATLTAFIVQVASGIALASIYVPSTADAYSSVQYITHDAWLGNLIRGMHYWGAGVMVVLIGAHMLRVFAMGAFKFPRELNWLSGSVLLLLTLAMAFTGQLLRWDQDSLWSVAVVAGQVGRVPLVGDWLGHFLLGGDTLGGPTLSHFFAFHVFFIPALVLALIGLHLFLVVRNGISEPPKLGRSVDPATYRQWYDDLLKRRGVPFWPDAAWRDMLAALAVVLLIGGLALFAGPSALGKPPDPTVVQADPRPDWYFIWYFAVLAVIPPAAESWVIVLAPLSLGFMLFVLPLAANRGERILWRRPWALVVIVGALMMIGSLWILGVQEPWAPQFHPGTLSALQIGESSGPVYLGARLFEDRSCIACHSIGGTGGSRGPDLSYVGDRLDTDQMIIRIMNGGVNMPAYGSILKPDELQDLLAFLQSRKAP